MLRKGLLLQSIRDGCVYVQLALRELPDDNSRLLLAVAGKTKAGKTYFAGELSRFLTALGVGNATLKCDRYFLDLDDPLIPKDQFDYPVFDHPDSYHHAEIIADINQLLRGESVFMPEYNLRENKRIRRDGIPVAPGRVIIVDGLFAIDVAQQIQTSHCLKFFIDACQPVRLKRRLAFDAQFCDSPERIENYFFGCVEPLQEKHVEPQRRFSDIILVNEGGGA